MRKEEVVAIDSFDLLGWWDGDQSGLGRTGSLEREGGRGEGEGVNSK